MWFKIKNIRTKNKSMKSARQTWKRKFIMLTYANMNMKTKIYANICKREHENKNLLC
jgi:hypothetical protein